MGRKRARVNPILSQSVSQSIDKSISQSIINQTVKSVNQSVMWDCLQLKGMKEMEMNWKGAVTARLSSLVVAITDCLFFHHQTQLQLYFFFFCSLSLFFLPFFLPFFLSLLNFLLPPWFSLPPPGSYYIRSKHSTRYYIPNTTP
ncbi:hypothetical protein BO86DRAFT_185800 [Aspergillus japonicus CBS 114.51]|uniref:Uncharacterized protein n=1 Tax=Aspergillus japonicus CBS 114.51 TaxID=1448312 RepID=A0A8T8XCU5_ASPJA|nr:hypothetical protein BO86DRAFT_185800 [Aspergillus japonicus CBS 114.51]RAH85232.1 hypothetical protein BO86DRAFT_185800 [Aspergillus japonicus CBS 114.51]